MDVSRRECLGLLASMVLGTAGASSIASAEHVERGAPDHVTISYDEATIREYQPRLVLEGVDPRPLKFHALHAESTESTLNAVYGFTQYAYQSGSTEHDSHLGDHEPMIIWYDQSSGDVERVDYAAYHWFRGTAYADSLQFADEERHKPIFRVDKTYHHYYSYAGDIPGEALETTSLLDTIGSWLNNGLEDNLALTQPFNPYDMLTRTEWWRHNSGNWIDATLKAFWFNIGLSGADNTADVTEVETW